MDDAPHMLGAPPASSEAEPGSAPEGMAAVAPAPSNKEFSPPRPLFGKKGGKRAGVYARKKSAETELTPVNDAVPAPAEKTVEKPAEKSAPPEPEKKAEKNEAVLPPMSEAPKSEALAAPSEQIPGSSSSGSMTAPAPEAMQGDVVYSQKAGENPPPPESASSLPATPDKPPVVSDEMIASPPTGPAPALVPPVFKSNSTHASCGAANGVGSPTKPVGNLCTQGNASDVTGKGPWKWTCKGEKGRGSASCSAPLLVNGECGLANGSQSATAPLRKQLCASGKSGELSGEGPWYWNCFGDNGGVVAQCTAYTLVSGACGVASKAPTAVMPANGLCASGTNSEVMGNGPWSWTCKGSGEGTSVKCTAPLRSDGACGPANGAGASERPIADLCASGIPSNVNGNGPWTWSCRGEKGGAIAECSTPIEENAACGNAHGVGVAARPATNLCSAGKASEVAGDGPWNWTCYGANGGARVDCMAPRKIDGACGPMNRLALDQAPDHDLCISGTPGEVLGSGPWQWTCQGNGGGLTTNCMADHAIPAACGSAHGVGSPVPPAGDLCASGTPTTVLGSGPWLWTCEMGKGGQSVNCMAPLLVNGACGPASDNPQQALPVVDLCRVGTPSAVSGTGPWNWACTGAGGGVSASCRALLYDPNAVPMAPPATASASPMADIPPITAKAGNECVPSVKRWTITCQQGGYPANYAGVIVGETQTLCPTGVERGVWLSNSCAPSTNSSPVSPSPGVLVTPPSPNTLPVTAMLPDVAPLPARSLRPSGPKLATPRFKDSGAASGPVPAIVSTDHIAFAPGKDGLDATATSTLNQVVSQLQADDKSIITLNAYAAMPSGGDQQEAQRLSLARALAVRSYLMSRGIANGRIDVRALGASDGADSDRVDIKVGS